MTPIRIELELSGSKASLKGVDQFVSAIDRSLATAFGKVDQRLSSHVERFDNLFRRLARLGVRGFGSGFNQINTSLRGMDANLASIERRLNRINAGSGGGAIRGGSATSRLRTIARIRSGLAYDGLSSDDIFAPFGASPAQRSAAQAVARQQRSREQSNLAAELNAVRRRARSGAAQADRLARERAPALARQEQYFSNLSLLNRLGFAPTGATRPDGLLTYANRRAGSGFFGREVTFGQQSDSIAGDLGQARGAWERFTGLIHRDRGRVTTALNTAFAPILALPRAIRTASGLMLGLAGTIYVAERLGRLVGGVASSPYRAIIDATERSRSFRNAISTVAGGPERAAQINEALIRQSQRTPIPLHALREAGQNIATLPSLSPLLSRGSPQQAAGTISSYAKLLTQLQSISPEQGVTGAGIAAREFLSGEYISIRRRFELIPGLISRSVGLSLEELNTPELRQKALQTFLDTFISEAQIQRLGQLFSVRFEKLREQFQIAAERIGDAGIFDSIIQRLERGSGDLFKFFDSAKFRQQARRLSESLDAILGNALDAGGALLQRLSGAKTRAATIEQVAEQLTRFTENLAGTSERLPSLGEKLGAGLTAVAGAVEGAAAELGFLLDVLEHPGRGASSFVRRQAEQVAPEYREATRLNRVMQVLDNLGLEGGTLIKTSIQGLGGPGSINDSASFAEGLKQFFSGPRALFGYRDEDDIPRRAAQIDLSAIQDPGQRLLAEQIVSALQGEERLTPLRVRSLLRERIPDFERRLRSRGARTDGAIGVDDPLLLVPPEFREPSFGNQFLNIQARYGALIEAASEKKTDPLSALFSQGSAALAGDLPRELLAINQQIVDAQRAYAKAVNERAANLSKRIGDPLSLAQGIAATEPLIDRARELRGTFEAGLTSTLEAMRQSSLGFSEQLIEATEGLPPAAREAVERQLIDGATAYARGVADIFRNLERVVPEFGIEGLPLRAQGQLIDRNIQTRLQRIDDLGQYGNLQLGQDFDEIIGLRPASDRTVAVRRAREIQDSLAPGSELREYHSRALGEYTTARQNRELAGSDLLKRYTADQQLAVAQRDLAVAADQVARLNLELRNLQLALPGLSRDFSDFARSIRESLDDNVGDAIYGLITGTSSLKDALRSFASDIVRTFSQIASRNLVQGLFGDFGVQQQSGGVGGLGGLLGDLVGGIGRGIAGLFTAAEGGILPGQFIPLHAFGDGGVVSRPTFGLIGERPGVSEAVIPLKHGRVPVEMRGNASEEAPLEIVLVNSWEEAVQRQLASPKARRLIIDTVTGNIREGGKIRKVIR